MKVKIFAVCGALAVAVWFCGIAAAYDDTGESPQATSEVVSSEEVKTEAVDEGAESPAATAEVRTADEPPEEIEEGGESPAATAEVGTTQEGSLPEAQEEAAETFEETSATTED